MKKYSLIGLTLLILSVGAGFYFILTDNISQAKFRTMQDPISSAENVDLTGLRDLQVSGGPSFTFSELAQDLAHIKKPIIIVDGQREDHGYIGTRPTVFFGYERKSDFRHTLRRLIFTGTTDVCKDCVEPEEGLAKQHGYTYKNLTIDSKIRTPDQTVDEFVDFVESLPDDVWAHFHCRLGKGRTSIMLIMYDTMKNAPQVTLEDIVKRQHLLGSEDMFDTVARSSGTYLSSTLLKRKKFIEDFYDFICQRKAGGIQKWTDWRAQRFTKAS